MPRKRTTRKSRSRSSKTGGRKRTYKRKSAYSKSRKSFIRKGRRNNIGTYYRGSEEIKLETPSLSTTYAKNISFELSQFPRLVDLHQNFKYLKVSKAQVRFVACQTNNYWYNKQASGNGCLRGVSWLNQDGDLSAIPQSFEEAANKPYSKTHLIVRGLMRNFTPKCIQQVQFEAPGATTIPITKNSNPYLLSDEALSVLRVAPGFWIPKVVPDSGDTEIYYEVFIKVWYSFKGVDV